MTFSIVAKCQRTGQFGVAAATAMPAVGKLVSHAWPGKGAVATQAMMNPYLGIDGVAMLRHGMAADVVVEVLRRADPRADLRQFAVVDAHGRTAAWTGEECPDWAGARQGHGYSLQGNRLAGPEVLEAAAHAFEETDRLPLAERLLAAIVAGDAHGGDTSGERSAQLFVVESEEYPLWDVRVDDHERPVAELQRLHGVFTAKLLPEIRRMPTRANPAGEASESTA